MNALLYWPALLLALTMTWLIAGCNQPGATTPTAVPTLITPLPTTAVVTRITPPLVDSDAAATAVTPSPTPTAASALTAVPTATPTPALPPPTATPLSVSGALTFEFIQHTGGLLHSLALAGETLWAGQGPRLAALNVSNSAQPQLIGQSNPLPGLVNTVLVRQQTAYLTAGRYLVLLDVSDPANMREQARLELPAAGSILLRDDIIYAAGLISRHYEFRDGRDINTFQSYIAAVDVSGAPRLLDTRLIPYPISAFALNGDALYIGIEDVSQPLFVLDVSDPAAISDLTAIRLPMEAVYSLRVYGDTLIAGGYYELAAFDVSDPLRPQRLWREEGFELGMVYDFAIAGNQIHTVGWQAAGGYIPAQTAVALPEPLPDPAYLSPTGQAGIIAVGDHLYTIHPAWAADSALGDYRPMTGGPLAAGENVLYVANESGRVDSYRLPGLNPVASYLSEPVDADSSNAIYGLTLAGDRLYLTGWEEVQILDAAGLRLMGAIRAPLLLFQQVWRGVSLPVVGNVAFTYAARTDNREELLRFDVSDPANPRRLDTIPLDLHLRVNELAVTEKWLAISLYGAEVGGQDYLALYDIRGETPQLIANIAVVQAPSALQFSDDLLLVGGDFLQLYRLPEATLLAELAMPGVFAVHVVDQVALVTLRQDNRLLAVDISNPAAPQVAGAFDLAAGAGYLAVTGDTIIVGNERMGLYVLQVDG